MSLRDEADADVIGISLKEEAFDGSDFELKSTILCMNDAEKRGITEYDHFAYLHQGDGMIPSPCADCGRIIA